MARILYLHGSQPGSFGDKTEDWTRSGTATKPSDASAGPTQDTQPASRGGSSLHHRRWLRGAVEMDRERYDARLPDSIVRSSVGVGVGATNLPAA